MIVEIIRAQHEALAGLPPGTLPASRGRAPLDPATLKRDDSWRVALTRILERMAAVVLPEPAQQARKALAGASIDALEARAQRFLEGDVKAADAAEMVF